MEELPLKDIHIPTDTLSFWPLAPGWWIVGVLLPLLCFLSIIVYKYFKQTNAIKSARKLLFKLKNDKNAEKLQILIAISVLIRRVAISTAPREQVAGLNGLAWLAYLDRSFKDAPFSQGVGRCLADAQYRKNLDSDFDIEDLFKLCDRWLKKQKPAKVNLFIFAKFKDRNIK